MKLSTYDYEADFLEELVICDCCDEVVELQELLVCQTCKRLVCQACLRTGRLCEDCLDER